MINNIKYTNVRFVPIQGSTPTKFQFDYGFRDVLKAISLVDLTQYKYFLFEDKEKVINKQDGIISVVSKDLGKSGKHFIDCYIETYEDVAVNNKLLANKMKEFGWKGIAKGVHNYWTEVFDEEKDQLIEI